MSREKILSYEEIVLGGTSYSRREPHKTTASLLMEPGAGGGGGGGNGTIACVGEDGLEKREVDGSGTLRCRVSTSDRDARK